MPVPNTFANATTSIPLSQLDANFATAITLGNTAIQLGNTVSTLNNMTLANVTISSGTVTVANVTVTGVGTFAAGSNTAPSITTAGDTNTGIYFPAADTIAFTEGGAEAMRIDSSGNVGIGTSSPTGKLHAVLSTSYSPGSSWSSSTAVFGGSTSVSGAFGIAYDDTNGAGLASIIPGTSYKPIYTNCSEFIVKTNGTTERMRIDSSGNLLVGTTTAAGKITVDGTVTLTNQAYAYYALSGTSTATGYASGQTVGVSIWTNDRVSSTEFNARSDARLKKDVASIPVEDAFAFINNVPAIHYKWKNNADDGHKFGFLAQDVVKAGFPNLVAQYPDSSIKSETDADGFTSPEGIVLTVNYDQVVPLLVAAIKELKAEIDLLKAKQ